LTKKKTTTNECDGFTVVLLGVAAILSAIGFVTVINVAFDFVSSVHSSQEQVADLQQRVDQLERRQGNVFYSEPVTAVDAANRTHYIPENN
jgi:hypothetical protein